MKTAFEGGTAVLIAAGRALQRKLQSPALLITRGSQGMALERGKPPYLLPVFGSTDIVDVTGAGDTVIAVFTAVLPPEERSAKPPAWPISPAGWS